MPVGDPKLAQIKIDRFRIIRIGEQAPQFVAKTLDGKPFELSDLRGKIVLVDFWATWCGPCIAEMPNIRKTLDKYGEDGDFVVLGISLDNDEKTVGKFIRKREIPWAQIVTGPADKSAIAQQYFVAGIPATFLIGPDGKVVAKNLRGKSLQKEVAKLVRKTRLAKAKRATSNAEKTARVEEETP